MPQKTKQERKQLLRDIGATVSKAMSIVLRRAPTLGELEMLCETLPSLLTKDVVKHALTTQAQQCLHLNVQTAHVGAEMDYVSLRCDDCGATKIVKLAHSHDDEWTLKL